MTTIHSVTLSQTTLDSTKEGKKSERSITLPGKGKWRTVRATFLYFTSFLTDHVIGSNVPTNLLYSHKSGLII